MAQKISQMTEQTTASMTEAGTSDFLGGYTATGGNANRKFSLSGLANYFLNKFKMTLGGSSQTVKSAIDALNSNLATLNGKLSNVSFRTVFNASSITGTFSNAPSASHSGIIFILNGNQTTVALVEPLMPRITVLCGAITYTASVDGANWTITPNTTLWGTSLVVIAEY